MSQQANSNQYNDPSKKTIDLKLHGIEPWMLTAFVLGELSPEEVDLVKQAHAQDVKLQEELTKIEYSIQRVSEVFSSIEAKSATDVGLLTSVQREAIISSIHPAGDLASQEVSAVTVPKLPFLRRPVVIAALVTAACIPLLIFSSKSILDYLGSDSIDNGPVAHVVPKQKIQSSSDKPSDEVKETPIANAETKQNAEASQEAVATTAMEGRKAEEVVRVDQSDLSGKAQPLSQIDALSDQSQSIAPSAVQGQALPQNAVVDSESTLMPASQPASPAIQQVAPAPNHSPDLYDLSAGAGSLASGPAVAGVASEAKFDSTGRFGGGDVMSRGRAFGGRGIVAGSGGTHGASLASEGFGLVPSSGPAGPGTSGYGRELSKTPSLPPELRQNLKSLPPITSVPVPSGDRFDTIVENQFEDAETKPVTTFSIDVDTASYSFVRQMLQQQGSSPSPDMVRIEEMVNYFTYSYEQPAGDNPFAANLSIAPCPWAKGHQLVRVGVQAKKVDVANRPRCNLVFLIDVSGSMADANKLPLVQRSLSMLVDRIEEGDRVAIAVYAGAAGLVLESTPGHNKEKIREAVYNLQAGGSTNGGEGIRLAYKIAKENFISGGANRVVLCTDGDFNVGLTNVEDLIGLVKEEAKSNVYLTCLGFGQGNYNDALMERISKDGNGLYGMVDSDREAKKLMVDQLMGTLVTVAKDVKLQMDFNPNLVKSYRLIGYENRQLSNADFNNDLKDAGDIGAGHSVTALYEIIPTTLVPGETSSGETESKYTKVKPVEPAPAKSAEAIDPEMLKEWLTLRIRFKQPEASESTKQEFVLENKRSQEPSSGVLMDKDFSWAASVAEFGLLLRKSKFAPNADWERLISIASSVAGSDEHRLECVELMRTAKRLNQPR